VRWRGDLVKARYALLFVLAFVMLLSVTPQQMQNTMVSHTVEEQFNPATGEAWLTGWNYRQSCTITGSAGAGTNYAVSLIVSNATGTSSGSMCYMNGHMLSASMGDVRFTANDGSTLLSYYQDPGAASKFKVKITASLESSAIIYVYYGKAAQTTLSDGYSTFIFYDDFESGNLNLWNQVDTGWTAQTTTKKYGSYAAYCDSDTTNRYLGHFASGANYTTGIMVHQFQRYQSTTTQQYYLTGMPADSSAVYSLFSRANTLDWEFYNGTYYNWEANTVGTSTWYELEMAYDFTNAVHRFWLDGVSKGTMALDNSGGTTFTSLWKLRIASANAANRDMWVDEFYIRKFVATEPTPVGTGAWGSQEAYNPNPANVVPSACTNADNGTLYARYKIYYFPTTVTDIDGFNDIHYIDLSLYDIYTDTIWIAQFHQPDKTWNEIGGAPYTTYIDLVTASCSYSESLNQIQATFAIRIEFVHPDSAVTGGPYSLGQYVIDNEGHSDNDWFASSNYNYETRLDLSVGPILTDGLGVTTWGSINGAITASGTIVYYGSSLHPPSSEVDVWVNCPDVASAQATNYEATGGTFSATVSAASAVKQSTYTCIAVAEGAGSGGTNQLHATHAADYIADAIKVEYLGSNSTYNELGHSVLLTVQLRSSYSPSTAITTGAFSLKYGSIYLTLQAWVDGDWNVTDSSAIATTRTYNSVNGSDTYYGINSIDMNSKSAICNWGNDWHVVGIAQIRFDTSDNIWHEAGIAQMWFDMPNWHGIAVGILIFWTPFYVPGLEALFILFGLILIPVSTLYLVHGGRDEMDNDKVFFFLILFLVGWALILGGIMP
jgi:hypothetical protein